MAEHANRGEISPSICLRTDLRAASPAYITAHPKITARLKAAGFSETDLAKMCSGNVLRVMHTAENAAESKYR
ncbi:MAG: hypothetical protein ABIP07_05180 [Sphingomicrobium sp.]